METVVHCVTCHCVIYAVPPDGYPSQTREELAIFQHPDFLMIQCRQCAHSMAQDVTTGRLRDLTKEEARRVEELGLLEVVWDNVEIITLRKGLWG